jgi:hypothetical protein
MLAFLGYLLCPIKRSNQWTKQPIGSMRLFARKVPDIRHASILDLLVDYVYVDADHDDWERRWELSEYVSHAIRRALGTTPIAPDRLWRWLHLLDSRHGGSRDAHKKLKSYFREHADLRRDVQRYALANDLREQTVWMKAWKLSQLLSSLALTKDDILVFLEEMRDISHPTDQDRQNWLDLVNLARSREGLPADLRAAARHFALGNKELLSFLRKAAKPIANKWEKRSEAREMELEAEAQARWIKHRTGFAGNLDALRAGELRCIVPAAQCYLALFNDVDRERPPLDRVRQWLGDDLAEAAAAGFEAALHRTD